MILRFLSDLKELFRLNIEKKSLPDLTILNTLIIFTILPILKMPIMGIDDTKSIQLDLKYLTLLSDLNSPIEKSIIKGDLVRFVQSANKKEFLLNDLANENNKDTIETITKWAARMGANFVVSATINSTQELKRKEKIIQYKIILELLNCETKQLVWLDEQKVSKRIILNQ